MPNDSGAALAAATRTVGSDDLAQGLLLVQASAMKVVRLQLAMERRDRRATLETVDELMRLDRRISDFLDDLPISDHAVAAAREEVQAQGRVLAREKFALTAGASGPRLSTEHARWAEPPPASPKLFPPIEPIDPDRIGIAAASPRGGGARSARLVAALLTFVLIVLAAAAFLFLSGAGPDLLTGLSAIEGIE
jgi:hypothetical protein